MFNFLDKIKGNPDFFRQLALDDQLITQFNCPLETKKKKRGPKKVTSCMSLKEKKSGTFPENPMR